MSDIIKEGPVLASFEAIWGRITGECAGRAAAAADNPAVLKRFVDAENRAADFYNELSRRCTGAARQELVKLSAQEKKHMCLLQTELFLITGDIHTPPDSCPRIDGVLTALGMAYRDEREAEAAYMRAAEETGREELSELYKSIAVQEAGHAGIIRGMVKKVMGQ